MNIFAKLFLLLALLSAVPLGIAAVMVVRQSDQLQTELVQKSSQTGEKTSRQSETALERQAERSHLQVVTEKAAQLRGFFENIRRAVLLQSTLIQHSLAADPPEAAPPLHRAEAIAARLQDPKDRFRETHWGRVPYAAYHLAPGVVPEAASRALDRLRPLGYFFAHNQRALPWCVSTYLGHRDGFILGYPGRSAYPKGYDPRKRPWFQAAANAGHLVWTDLYLDRNGRDRVITCASPVYGPGGRTDLVAVAAIDVKLTQIVEQLFDLRGLTVSDAVLLDGVGPQDRVVVSRVYEKQALQPADQARTAELTRVADVRDAQFQHVMALIRERLRQGRDAGNLPVPALGSGATAAMYTYATIPLKERSYDGQGRDKRWTYLVKTPHAEIVAPVQGIRKVHLDSQRELRKEIAHQVHSLWIQILVVSLLVLLAALVAAFLAARSSTRPLVAMAEVAERIGRGDLDQQVPVTSRDEVGQLAKAINGMVEGLKERDFIRSTFKNYVASSVVDELLENPEKLKLGGERRVMTVFFSDLAGFTTMSETLSPEELIRLINEYLGAMTEGIATEAGTLDKYEGDAIMAFWGAPMEQPDHALRACRAALHNVARLRELWTSWEARGIPHLDLRIGLNTGPMVVGNTGSEQLKNYTVMGDAVNLGSRLEGVGKIYGTRILVSEATRQAAGEGVVTREIDTIAVKGRSQAVRIFELVGLAGEVPEATLRANARFEEGLAAYRSQAWDEAEAAFREVVTALGEDPPSEVFLSRVARFRVEPPPEHWDGTYRATSK